MSYANHSYGYTPYGGQQYCFGQTAMMARVSPPLAQSNDANADDWQDSRARGHSYPPPPSKFAAARPQFTAFTPVQPRKKRVTFKPTCTVRTHSSNDPSMTKEEASKLLYYSKQELKILTLEAHAICTLSQELPDIRNPGTLLTHDSQRRSSMLGLEDTRNDGVDTDLDSLRGLELIMYPKRKQNKILAQRSLLKYQQLLKSKHDISPERKSLLLAAASAKLNLWSSLVAMETARLDALRAYESDYMVPMSAPVDIASPFSFYARSKRRREHTSKERKTRRRGSRRITLEGRDESDEGIRPRDSKRMKPSSDDAGLDGSGLAF